MDKIIELPELNSCLDAAIDAVVSILNKAQTKMGVRQNLFQLAHSRDVFGKSMFNLCDLGTPLAIKSEKLIAEAINRKWRLTENFMYVMKYFGISEDESAQYHYYEVIFSQASVRLPISDATVSVYFRVGIQNVESPICRRAPTMVFTIEGHRTEHDVRFTMLTMDWLLAVMQMKLLVFKRIEKLRIF